MRKCSADQYAVVADVMPAIRVVRERSGHRVYFVRFAHSLRNRPTPPPGHAVCEVMAANGTTGLINSLGYSRIPDTSKLQTILPISTAHEYFTHTTLAHPE